MQNWFNQHILPLLIAGGGIGGVAIIVLPILLRYIGKIKKATELARQEVTKLQAVANTIEQVNSDLAVIKAKQDYTDTIKVAVAEAIKQELTNPMLVMQGESSDVLSLLSVVHDAQLKLNSAALLAWTQAEINGVQELLATSPSMSVLYKKESDISKLKAVIREIKGDDAEALIVKAVSE